MYCGRDSKPKETPILFPDLRGHKMYILRNFGEIKENPLGVISV
jgi:hypothetical protein